MKFSSWILIFLFSMFFSSCAPANVKVTVTPAIDVNGYPINPTYQAVTAYPEPGDSLKISIVDPQTIQPPQDAPNPETGKASISGVLFSSGNSTILAQFWLYLTPAQGPDKNLVPPILVGPLTDKGDIAGISDDDGKFEMNNIDPGNYYLVVVMPNDFLVAVNSIGDVNPKMITLSADEKKPLGLVVFP